MEVEMTYIIHIQAFAHLHNVTIRSVSWMKVHPVFIQHVFILATNIHVSSHIKVKLIHTSTVINRIRRVRLHKALFSCVFVVESLKIDIKHDFD